MNKIQHLKTNKTSDQLKKVALYTNHEEVNKFREAWHNLYEGYHNYPFLTEIDRILSLIENKLNHF